MTLEARGMWEFTRCVAGWKRLSDMMVKEVGRQDRMMMVNKKRSDFDITHTQNVTDIVRSEYEIKRKLDGEKFGFRRT
jgi:hypothetical protein